LLICCTCGSAPALPARRAAAIAHLGVEPITRFFETRHQCAVKQRPRGSLMRIGSTKRPLTRIS
jgi:hypothetical protein